jgi:hypothetical protein
MPAEQIVQSLYVEILLQIRSTVKNVTKEMGTPIPSQIVAVKTVSYPFVEMVLQTRKKNVTVDQIVSMIVRGLHAETDL